MEDHVSWAHKAGNAISAGSPGSDEELGLRNGTSFIRSLWRATDCFYFSMGRF